MIIFSVAAAKGKKRKIESGNEVRLVKNLDMYLILIVFIHFSTDL